MVNTLLIQASAQLEQSDIDIMVGASLDFVAMVEGECHEISEKEMADAIKVAHEAIKIQIEAQKRLVDKVGIKETRSYEAEKENQEMHKKFMTLLMKNVMPLQKKTPPNKNAVKNSPKFVKLV